MFVSSMVCMTLLSFPLTAIPILTYHCHQGIHQGLGQHLWVLGPSYASDFYKNIFVGELCYSTTLCLVKLSIVAFYRTLFERAIRIPVCILAGVIMAWFIAVVLVTIFQCIPVSGLWNKEIVSTCNVSLHNFLLGHCIPNILTDVAILVSPLPNIFRLKRSRRENFALAGIFMLGGL